MTRRYDLIVIGAGMAGVSAANKCASQGWTVAIVDALPYGGTWLRGCGPKKILRRGAEIIDNARLMRGKDIDDADLSINWADLMKHKHGFTDRVPQNMENSLSGNGIDTPHGVAGFTDKNSIEVGGILYEVTHFLIATGARPRPLDFPGHEHLVDYAGVPTAVFTIPELALAMKLDLTTRELKSVTAAYPTIGSALGSML